MSLDKNKTIGVFFGSRSPEHDVSIITAHLVISGLKSIGYEVVPVYIGKSGEWYIHDELGEIDFFKDPLYEPKLKSHGGWTLSLTSNKGKMTFVKGGVFKKTTIIDIAFPTFHGRNGEDGTIQGLFELIGVPYVGCGVLSSALAMNKVMTKEFYEHAGIPTTDFVSFKRDSWSLHKEDIKKEINALHYPLFVKPSRTGSSIGISKVKDEKDLEVAIEVAFHYDNEILVEEGVENVRDLTCAVIGHSTIEVSLVQESMYSSDLFSYEDKYIRDGGAQTGKDTKSVSIPPKNIDEKVLEKIQLMSKSIYDRFGCSGIARIDFLYNDETKKVYANEINTLPGTLYHHLWKESGINLSSLLEKLLLGAKEKSKEDARITSSFSSSILEDVSGSKFVQKLHLQQENDNNR